MFCLQVQKKHKYFWFHLHFIWQDRHIQAFENSTTKNKSTKTHDFICIALLFISACLIITFNPILCLCALTFYHTFHGHTRVIIENIKKKKHANGRKARLALWWKALTIDDDRERTKGPNWFRPKSALSATFTASISGTEPCKIHGGHSSRVLISQLIHPTQPHAGGQISPASRLWAHILSGLL